MEVLQLREKLEEFQLKGSRSSLGAKENIPQPPMGRLPQSLLRTRGSLGKPGRSSSLESTSDSSSDRFRLSVKKGRR